MKTTIIDSKTLIKDQLAGFKDPENQIRRMIENKELVRLKRGLYETNPKTPKYLVANELYGPSYVSFEYALSRHNVIPERVVNMTSATTGKNRSMKIKNSIGTFFYWDVPADAFPIGIETWTEQGREYRIASKEKAVCDKLYQIPSIRTLNDIDALMFDDLRFDEEEITSMDMDLIADLASRYHSTTVSTMARFLGAIA